MNSVEALVTKEVAKRLPTANKEMIFSSGRDRRNLPFEQQREVFLVGRGEQSAHYNR